MSLVQQIRKVLIAIGLILVLTTTTVACNGAVQARQPVGSSQTISNTGTYALLERGNTPAGQDFGEWVIQTGKGLVQDAYVRDNNKLGVVIAPQVRPKEVQPLARSLAQGFHKNFPNQDLTVLMYAHDKKLILTAKYDAQSKKLTYE